MNRRPQSRFEPSSPLARAICVAAALAATLATAEIIDAIALGPEATGQAIVDARPAVVAQH